GVSNADANDRGAGENQHEQSRVTDPREHREDVRELAERALDGQRNAGFESRLRKADEAASERQDDDRHHLTNDLEDAVRLLHVELPGCIWRNKSMNRRAQPIEARTLPAALSMWRLRQDASDCARRCGAA